VLFPCKIDKLFNKHDLKNVEESFAIFSSQLRFGICKT